MKRLLDYLTESDKQYVYRVKIAGEMPDQFYDKFKVALGAFDVQDCTKPSKTPIQPSPVGFPDLSNEEVTIFDITLNYPANSQQITDMARLHGVSPAKIIVIDKAFDDSMNADIANAEDVDSVLDTPEYPEQSKEQKAASDDYASSYQEAAAQFAGSSNTRFKIAGNETTKVANSTDADHGMSPLSSVKRQPIKDMKR